MHQVSPFLYINVLCMSLTILTFPLTSLFAIWLSRSLDHYILHPYLHSIPMNGFPYHTALLLENQLPVYFSIHG